jgi:hypothetical protein
MNSQIPSTGLFYPPASTRILVEVDACGKGGSILSGDFDPYHRWLGIPPKDQPPNHYRLLGLDLFESDPEVIRDAADRQMAHVRTYQLGPHVDLSQQLLNELATARICLLDLAKKGAYDAALRRRLQRPTKTPVLSDDSYWVTPPISTVQAWSKSQVCADASLAAPRVQSRPPAAAAQKKSSADEVARQPKPHYVAPEITNLPRGLSEIARPRPIKPPSQLGNSLISLIITVIVLVIGGILAYYGYGKVVEVIGGTNFRGHAEPPEPIPPDDEPQPAELPPVPVKLEQPPARTIEENTPIEFKVGILDRGSVGPRLRFSLGPGKPVGATITPITGIFSWRPSREQAGRQYPITICASEDGSSEVIAQTVFCVSVRRIVKPPRIAPITEKTVCAGSRRQFDVRLSDSDPTDRVVFSLQQAPPWMLVDSATGTVTCSPDQTVPPRTYTAAIRAASSSDENARSEQTFSVSITSPMTSSEPPKAPGSTQPNVLTLPSGAKVDPAQICMLGQARTQILVLSGKVQAGAPDVIALDQGGTQVFATRKGTKLQGVTLFLYLRGNPKHYFTYRSGTLHGAVATWDERGQQLFWCKYSSGRRDGICCFFENGQPAVVLECKHDKTIAIHLVQGNQVKKSFADEGEASSDEIAGRALKRIDEIEQGLKEDDRLLRQTIRQAVQKQVGAMNEQKRAAVDVRRAERAVQLQQQVQALKTVSGVP